MWLLSEPENVHPVCHMVNWGEKNKNKTKGKRSINPEVISYKKDDEEIKLSEAFL